MCLNPNPGRGLKHNNERFKVWKSTEIVENEMVQPGVVLDDSHSTVVVTINPIRNSRNSKRRRESMNSTVS